MSMFQKLVLVQVLLLGFQIIVYFGSEKLQHHFHNVLRKADESIPFLPWTVLVYSLWFPLIAFFPIGTCYANAHIYAVYLTAMFLDIVISVICYVIWPTTFTRPIPPDTWSGKLMKFVYKGSYRGLNCAPSLHCSSCYLIFVFAAVCPGMLIWVRILCMIISASIVVSTMTTKQHALLDALTAFLPAAVCLALGFLLPASGIAAWVTG